MLNKKVPDVIFKTRVRDDSISGDNSYRWEDRNSDSYFLNKRVVLFSLPGAFTPIFSTFQLPDYDKLYPDFKKNGMDGIYCIAVNDAFVMNAWFRDQNIQKVKPIGDGEGLFTKGMGMLVNKPKQGFGMRSWRYSAYIDNCKVLKIFVENGKNNESNDNDPFELSDVNTMLDYLKKD